MSAYRAKIRMYRQGLGDCWLIALPRTAGAAAAAPFYVMIDCGVVLGTPDAAATMQRVVADVAATTNGKIDLLVATHEHWDHLSGFIQAREQFAGIEFGAVWLAWTENPADPQAQALAGERAAALRSLRLALNRLRLAGADDAAGEIDGLLGLFGAAGGSTSDALQAVRGLSKVVRYCDPADAPQQLPQTSVRVYALGPPRDEKLLKELLLSPSSPDMYGIAAPSSDDDAGAPFDEMQAIPLEVAREMPFFRRRYWGSDVAPSDDAADWRRIDGSWLEATSELALQLDSATNNTSLVLAFELENGDVLLFPGDAQVGNWLSWQSLAWSVDGANVKATDLLARCAFYKVGHHGSHNATLKEHGLEMMQKLATAMIPVDHAVAVTKHWDRMPLPALLDALAQKANGAVIRADEALPAGSPAADGGGTLYYEVTL